MINKIIYLISLFFLIGLNKFKKVNINSKNHKYLWYKQSLQGVKL